MEEYYREKFKKAFDDWQETEEKCTELRNKLFPVRDFGPGGKIEATIFSNEEFDKLFKLEAEAEKKRQEFGKIEQEWHLFNKK